MSKRSFKVVVLSILLASTLSYASNNGKFKGDADDFRDGKAVFQQVCVHCHSHNTIPSILKMGDKKAWKKLIEEGQQFPSAHGWVGTRMMPPKGGDPKILLPEFINAVAFMANAAGADWNEYDDLDPKILKEILKEIQIRLDRNELYDKVGINY